MYSDSVYRSLSFGGYGQAYGSNPAMNQQQSHASPIGNAAQLLGLIYHKRVRMSIIKRKMYVWGDRETRLATMLEF